MEGYIIKSKTCIYTEEEVLKVDKNIEDLNVDNPMLQIIFNNSDVEIKTRNFDNWNVRYDKETNGFILIDPTGAEDTLFALNNMWKTVKKASNLKDIYNLVIEDISNYFKTIGD